MTAPSNRQVRLRCPALVQQQVSVVSPLAITDYSHVRQVHLSSLSFSLLLYLPLYNRLSSRTMAPGCSISPVGMIRLSNSGVCKISGCGQTGELYINDVHNIRSGKHGSEIMSCPWEGGETKTKCCFSNHLLSHSVKSGCGVCDAVSAPRSDSVQKHFRSSP